MVLQGWAIVLTYSSEAKIPEEIMKRNCINNKGITGLADLAGALDALSALGPIELIVGLLVRVPQKPFKGGGKRGSFCTYSWSSFAYS